MYEAHYASREDIDTAMRLGCRYPMGPLALLDLIGLDTAYEILDTMYKQGRDRLHAPAPILKQLVTAGMLGRKSGRGFYTYEVPGSPVVVDDELTPSTDVQPQLRRPVAKVGVVGTGTMATGIVEVMARGGYDVTYVGRGFDKVDAVRSRIERSLDKAIERGKLEESERGPILDRISGTTTLTDLADADLVVEAVVEDVKVKTPLFESLDGICKPGAILATTTSSLPVIELAMATQRPQDVVGLHFFNPAQVMELVEVVSTVSTSDEVAETARAVCASVGKVAVSCGDRAGFIVNALLFPYLNDAVKMLQAHYATADDIDTAMKLGCRAADGSVRGCSTSWATDVSRPWRSRRSSTWSSASPASRRLRCWSSWSPPATSAARPSGGSATTQRHEPSPPPPAGGGKAGRRSRADPPRGVPGRRVPRPVHHRLHVDEGLPLSRVPAGHPSGDAARGRLAGRGGGLLRRRPGGATPLAHRVLVAPGADRTLTDPAGRPAE